MNHLSSSSCGIQALGTGRGEPPQPPGPAIGGQSITSCRRSALLVENDPSLKQYFLRILKDKGYAVRSADDADESIRLYRECGPFNVVLINYCLTPKPQVFIDNGTGETNGVNIALAIRQVDPSQKMIIAAFHYQSEEEVVRPQELKDAVLLLDTRNFKLRCLLERIEVDRAIEELTIPDLHKLRWIANFRINGLGRAACGRTGDDLLGEALRSTLEGTRHNGEGRHWNKDVDFVTHLAGAMRSISSCWKRKFDRAFLESELVVCDIEGHKTTPLDDVPSCGPAPDQCVIAMEEEKRIIALFANDSHAILVLRGIFDGMQKNDILQKYGLIEQQYTAALKRITLKLYGRSRKPHRQRR